MTKYSFIILFFLIFSNSIYSQQIIKDEFTSNPIPFVEIYSDKGDLIGLSNEDGTISIELNKKIYLSNSRMLTFFHFSFERKAVPIDYYKNSTFLTLNSTPKILEEVVISNNLKKKYLKLKGYFRSSQINEDRVQYFMDGIVEYYIATGSNKIKMKIIYHRTFENKNIKQLSKRYYFLVAGVPTFNDFFKLDMLSYEYNLNVTNNKLTKITDKKNHTNRGLISNQDNLTSLQLEIISKENPKIMKFFGMESHLNNYNITSVYNTTEKTNINFKKIIYFKEIREYIIRRKKKENFAKVDAIHEFFLLNKEYTNDLGTGNFDDFYSFKTNSYYNINYWENIKNIIYQPLPVSLEKYITDNLHENKNIFLEAP